MLNDRTGILILSFIALMLIVIAGVVGGMVIPTLNKTDHRATVACRAAEQFGDDRAVSLKESERAIRLRSELNSERPGDEILLANIQRSRDDIASINFGLDQECS